MINLERKKDHKWIFQKNISSSELMKAYVEALSDIGNNINLDNVKQKLRNKNLYKGRSTSGNVNTMGVRFSQMCFYMFGYKIGKKFMPSPMTLNILNSDNNKINIKSNSLINLFSMQFPQPYSNTPATFNIYCGRLIVKLLLDKRIDNKLYIDEMIWFLPFLEKINENIYNELIESILEFRNLSYMEKLNLFKSVRDYDNVFSNVTHEVNYYFLRIFQSFGVLDINKDENHNEGHLFSFNHGRGVTKRTDAYKSGAKVSGYVTLSKEVVSDATKLIETFSAFDYPPTQASEGIFSLRDWLTELYEVEPLEYLNCISNKFTQDKIITDVITRMTYVSKYGSSDGKEFEQALKPFIELFRETENVEIISGAGNTDLLCAMRDIDTDVVYNMNVDAKTRKSALEEINARRINNHLEKHGSKFCIIVAPKFAMGVKKDIEGHKIVVVRAEELGAYCYRECTSSRDGYADFTSLLNIIKSKYGSDITEELRDLTQYRYGIAV